MIEVKTTCRNVRDNCKTLVGLGPLEHRGVHMVHLWTVNILGHTYLTITAMNAREIAAALILYADVSDRHAQEAQRPRVGGGG